jgi:prepilin-type N-terminal cleavage/methylation domain-containing protein
LSRLRAPRTSATSAQLRAFTLIELVTVMLLITIVLSLSAPSLKGFFAGRQTADFAQTVVALTQFAHSQALAHGQPCRLNIEAASGQCWVTLQDAGRFVPVEGDLGRHFAVPEDSSLRLVLDPPDPSANYVEFFPNGRNNVATIEVRGRRGQLYQITCPSATEAFHVVTPLEAP